MSYWTTPEDISATWARIRPILEDLGNQGAGGCVSVTILVNGGVPDGLTSGPVARLEPSPADGEGREWWSVIRRFISCASGLNGARGAISAHIWVNAQGYPVRWTRPNVSRIEPNLRR